MHHHQLAKITDKTPQKGESDQSIASVTLFETPGKGGVVRDDGDTTSCSQELFGSPEIFTPAQVNHPSEHDIHHISEENSSPHNRNEDTSHIHEQEPISGLKEEVTDMQQGQAINWEQQTPLLVKGFSCEPHLLPHSTPLSSLTQAGPTCNVSSYNAFPYSSTQPQNSVPTTPLNTPLCSTVHPRSSYQPSQVTKQTPNIPLILAKERSPITHNEQPLVLESAAVQVISKTPVHEKKSNTEQNYSFGSVGDVMDLLFMSSSQLDAHLSAHKNATECEPTRATVNELIPKETLSVLQTPSSDLVKSETDESILKQNSNGLSLATLDTREDPESNRVNVDTKDVQLNTEEAAKAKRKGIASDLKAKAFRYPTKQKSNLKRKKSNIRTREYSVPQKSPERTDATKTEVEEPLAKRPRIHGDSDHGGSSTVGDQSCVGNETTDDVIKVEESMVDHLNKDTSPPYGAEMDIDVAEKKFCIEEHLEEKAIHSSCSTNIPSEQSKGQSEDMQVTEVEMENTVPLSSENMAMACMSVRAPGLRRINKKSKEPVAFYPSPKELKCEAKVPDATESIDEAMQCPAVDPPEELPTGTVTIKNSAPLLGFQTAAGSAITVSEKAMKIAHQLIGTECELEEGHPNKSPETPRLIPLVLATTTVTTSALTTTPSGALNQMREPILNTTAVTPASSFTSPLLSESVENPKHSAATFPRRPNRRPAKPFKVPRKANDVSAVEEQASVARILRSFRASGAATEPPVHKSTRSRIHRFEQPIETGFQTAGGSRVTVSSEAMEKAQKLATEDKENGISTDTGSPVLNSNGKEHTVTGFKTASGSKLVVSSEAMEKAEKLVATGMDSLKSSGRKEQLVTGFKTAGGSRLMVSSEAMKKAQKLVDEDKENGISAECTYSSNSSRRREQVVAGFKTASGKGLSASASLMAQAVKKFKEDTSSSNDNNTGRVGFQMASEKNLSLHVPVLSLQKAESLLSSELKLDTESDPRDFVPTGFKTAGGSGISVSAKSLKCAKELVEEEKDNLQQFDDIKTSLFQSPLQEETRESARVMTGFSTAGGISISVSRTSLQECEKMIETGECKTSLNFDNSTTVESGSSPCSLTAEDVETFSAFTQMNFERQSPKSHDKCDLSPHSPTDTPSESATHNEQVNKECDVDADAEATKNENDDHSSFFSTQVVKQLTDFSSEEEMSCDEEDDTAAAAQDTDKQASCYANTVNNNNNDGFEDDQLVEVKEEHGEDLHVQSQYNEMERHDDSISRDENDSVVSQHVDAEVVDLLSESLLLREFHEAETCDHQRVDESTLEVNLSGVLSESMIENMDISINVSTLQPNSQEQATATKVCVVNTASGSHKTSQTVQEMSHEKTPLQHQASFPGPSQPSLPGRSQLSVSGPSQSSPSDPSLFGPQPSLPGPSQPSLPGPSQSSLLRPSQPSLPKSSLPGPFQPSLPGPSQSSLCGPSQLLSAISRFPGLQTASGKQVHISESALKVAKQVLGSNSSDPVPPLVHDEKPTCSSSLLQTASGKLVHVSEASLRAVRGMLNDDGEAGSTPTSHSPQERGFEHRSLQTASGKKVEVSESALLAVKKILGSSSGNASPSDTVNSFVPYEPPQPHPIGLMTAGGRKVQISEEALAAVRSSSRASCMNIGLQTASGNEVEISKESMRAAKLLLNSDPSTSSSSCTSSTGSGFPGLSTASGTKVAISQKALEAARATLDDRTPSPHTPSQNRSFPGLTTASGSKVTISEDSLQAARAVLGSTSTANNYCDGVPPVPIKSVPRKDDFTEMCSKSQPFVSPVTTQPSSLPGAPTRKYKPIFRSGGARNERGHTSFSSRMSDATTTPLTSSDTRGQQQWLTQSRTGVISTPEGKL